MGDEACAKLKNELTSKPTILDEIDRRIIQLEMERLSLKSDFEADENDQNKKDEGVRLSGIDKELNDLQNEQEELNLKWMAEKGGVDRIKDIKTEIAAVNLEIEKCEREFDLNQAAELKYSKLPPLVDELAVLEKVAEEKGAADGKEDRMLRDEVVADDIASVVAVWTGIPPTKLLESERDRILKMADTLKDRVIGQDEAIEVVTEAVQRSRAGLNDPSKPIASMVFLGPTGVGKTELCKALSDFMFDSEDAIIRIDMSEYMEKHTVSRLVGAPPGYVGYDEGGQLTEAVRRKPYSVVLLDEIEKAHPDTFNILLQVLDEGRLTDNKGRVADFKNCIIIMTSNLGSDEIQKAFENNQSFEKAEELATLNVMELLKKNIRPEFLNRIDEIILFTPLTRNEIEKIVKLQITITQNKLKEKSISLYVTDEAISNLS